MPFKLHLRAWQTHADVELKSHRPVVIVAGANASGKTAMLDGLEFVSLGTGKLRGIKTKAELAFRSIRDDAEETEITLGWPGCTLERSMDRGAEQAVTVNGTTYKVTRGDAKIREALGVEPEQLRAALEADHLLEGDENSRRRVLFQAAGAEVARDQVAAALGDTGLSGEDIGRLTEMAIGDGFKDAQTYAEGQRAARTSRLKEPRIEPPEPRINPGWAGREIRLDQINLEDLGTRERELEAMLRGATRQAGVDRGALQARLQRTQEDHTALVEEGATLSERASEDLDALRDAAATARATADTRERYEKTQAEKVRKLGAQARALEGLELEAPNPCPAIPGGPKCPMTTKRLETHRQSLENRREKILADLDVAEEERRLASTSRFEAVTTAETAEQERDAAQEIAKRLEQIQVDLDEAEQAVVAAQAALAAPATTESSEDREAEIEGRLANLRELTSAKRTFETAVVSSGADVKERQKKEAERVAWDAAAKLLAPAGLPSRLFGQQIPMLQDFIDEIGIAEIRVTPEVALEARVDGRWRTRTQLSESWKLRLSMAASHMVARVAGFPLLVLDRFDHLDPVGRRAVLEGARRVASHYLAGVLILATLQREKPEPTGLPDVETWWLNSAGLERIG